MFLLIPLVILFASHWLVYDFFVRAFEIKKKKSRMIFRLILMLLFFAFITSFALARLYESWILELSYFIFGLWLGFLINLVLVIALKWVIIGVLRFFGKKVDLKLAAKIVILFTVFYSAFGAYNALHPQVTEVEVAVENLPPEWQGKTIVQISDLHLGAALRENFLKRVVAKVNELDAEIVVVTGDLLDGSADGVASFIGLLDDIKTKKGVYFVTGNHEDYVGIEKSLSIIKSTDMEILDDEVVEIDGLQLIGISYPERGVQKNARTIIEESEIFDGEKPNILLYHAPVSIIQGQEETVDWHKNLYWTPNTDFSGAKELGIDLQLSGHTHDGQIFPFTLLTKLIFNGYSYGLHQENGFAIYVSSGAGVWGPTMRTGSESEIVAIKLLAAE